MDQCGTYIFAGGGSGGHLTPGIAVAEELRRRLPAVRVVFAGSERPLEKAMLQGTGFEHDALPVESLRELRRAPWRFCRRNGIALRQAWRMLKNERPRGVIGLGGFASAPTVWWARRLGIPVLLLEQNAVPGAATRWLARGAEHVCLSFEEAAAGLRGNVSTIVTGNPVRESVLLAAAGRHVRIARPDRQDFRLLILGGSQGAEALNEAVLALLPRLESAWTGWSVVHQTGPGRSTAVRERYRQLSIPAVVEDFFPHLWEWYADADLVISRAGATTLAELACVGCPSILVPYPFAADRHQEANAEVFARRGAAAVVAQGTSTEETAERLHEPFRRLLTNREARDEMSRAALELARPDAARRIVDLLIGSEEPSGRRGDRSSRLVPNISQERVA